MTDPSTLLALIEKLEKAEAGNRALDREIATQAGTVTSPSEHVYVESRSIEYIPELYPHYTTSIDAALTLVPDGWIFSLVQADPNKPPSRGGWWVTLHNFGSTGADDQTARHTRAPVAICIAALMARHADAAWEAMNGP